jgi:hypothetical protein
MGGDRLDTLRRLLNCRPRRARIRKRRLQPGQAAALPWLSIIVLTSFAATIRYPGDDSTKRQAVAALRWVRPRSSRMPVPARRDSACGPDNRIVRKRGPRLLIVVWDPHGFPRYRGCPRSGLPVPMRSIGEPGTCECGIAEIRSKAARPSETRNRRRSGSTGVSNSMDWRRSL